MVAVSFFVHKPVIDCHLVGKVFEMLRVLCEVFDIAENKLGFPLIRTISCLKISLQLVRSEVLTSCRSNSPEVSGLIFLDRFDGHFKIIFL